MPLHDQLSAQNAVDTPEDQGSRNADDGQIALRNFAGVFVFNGEVRKMNFQAKDRQEAQQIALRWQIGVKSEVDPTSPQIGEAATKLPEAYNLKQACLVLGGVSSVTIYRWVIQRKLLRVPGIRKVLITRASIERMLRLKS